MCGFGGVVGGRGVEPRSLLAMAGTLRHRGPDDEGYWTAGTDGEAQFWRGDDTVPEREGLPHIREAPDTAAPVGLMHRRLSILDLSAAGHQPMTLDDGHYVLAYNGEVYNYRELRAELETEGVRFRSHSDTEVILAAYRSWGAECVRRFVGMWALALVDTREQTVLLSRDRYGIKPLYYARESDRLAFASEVKALFHLPGFRPLLSADRAVEYLAYGATADPDTTLFQGVREVPPGHQLMVDFQGRVLSCKCYYRPGAEAPSPTSDPVGAYREQLEESVALHLRSDVEVGSCLSGGLDSSGLVALAAPQLDQAAFHTFTASYEDPAVDESEFARLVADDFPNVRRHACRPHAEDFWDSLDRLLWHQDEPIHSTSIYAQWTVMECAADHGIKVLLDGQGADEVIGGYSSFAGVRLLDLLRKGRLLAFVGEARDLRRNRSVSILKEAGRAGYYGLPPGLQRWIRFRNRLGPRMFSECGRRTMRRLEVPERGGVSFREHCLSSILFGMRTLLRYEDRNSMAFSIESRVPFLDHRFVELVLALPDEWKIRDGWSKYVQRKALEGSLHPEVVWRRDKKGFVTPQRTWKEELQPRLRAFLSDVPMPGFLDRRQVLEALGRNLPRPSDLNEFWRLVTFLRWSQVHDLPTTDS